MKIKNAPSSVIIALALLQASVLVPKAANTLTPAEVRAGWTMIFDGVDKNANLRVGETGTTNSWTINAADSSLASPNTGAMLFTKQSYSNFEFKVDWKQNLGGNSGMFFRVNPTIGWFCSGPEFGILDDANGGDRTSMLYLPGETAWPGKRMGTSYDMYATTLNGANQTLVVASLPYGQWSQGVYWANGNFTEHWLNGQKVVDYETGSADWQQRLQLSKFWAQCSGQRTTYGKNPTGLIGFQDHGGGLLVWYRNMKVRPFTPGEVLISPMYTPNGGNFTTTVTVVLETGITGAEIRYTTDGSQPTATSPLYTGPLTLNATTTVNARTFRPRFTQSVVSTATFTRNPTPIRGNDLSPAPEISYSQAGGNFMIRNGNRQVFTVEFFSPTGEKVKTVEVGIENSELAVGGLKSGLYLVKASRGAWSLTRKITLR